MPGFLRAQALPGCNSGGVSVPMLFNEAGCMASIRSAVHGNHRKQSIQLEKVYSLLAFMMPAIIMP